MKEAGLISTEAAADWVKSYFKVVNDCGTDYSPCFADEYKLMNGASKGAVFANDARKFVLASGSSISVSGHTNGNISFLLILTGKKVQTL